MQLIEGWTRAGELRAAALVADVRVDDGDAIRAEIEHRDGHVVTVLLPYEKPRFGRAIECGDLRAGPARPRFWPVATS